MPEAGLYVLSRSSMAGHAYTRGIYKVDTVTGATTRVVNFLTHGIPEFCWKPMFRPVDGTVWVQRFNVELWQFDADTDTLLETYTTTVGSSLCGGVWHNDLLYLPDRGNDGRVVSFDPSTGVFTTLVGNLHAGPVATWPGEDLTIINDRIYISRRVDPSADHYIWSCLLDGSGVRVEYTSLTDSRSVGITAIGNYIYGGSVGQDQVERYPVNPDGTIGTREDVALVTDPISVATDGVDMYVGNNRGKIVKISTLASPTSGSVLLDTEDINTNFGDIEYVVWFDGINDGCGWTDLGRVPGGDESGSAKAVMGAITTGPTAHSTSGQRILYSSPHQSKYVYACTFPDLVSRNVQTTAGGWAYAYEDTSSGGHVIRGLALSPNDAYLYALTESGGFSALRRFSTASTSDAGTVLNANFPPINGQMVWSAADGMLYAVSSRFESAMWGTFSPSLRRLNPSTGAHTVVATYQSVDATTITTTPDGAIWFEAGDSGQLIRYDPAANEFVSAGSLTGWTGAPIPLNDSSVLHKPGGSAKRFTYADGAITYAPEPDAEYPPATSNGYVFYGSHIGQVGFDAYNVWVLDLCECVPVCTFTGWENLGLTPDAEQPVMGALMGDTVFYAEESAAWVLSATFPELQSLNTKQTGTPPFVWNYTYLVDIEPSTTGRSIQGVAIAGQTLYVLVDKSQTGNSGGELWAFDATDPDDPGEIVAFYPASPNSDGIMRGHMAYNPSDNRLYIAESHSHWNGSSYDTSLTSIEVGTWTRTRDVTFPLGTGQHYVIGSLTVTPANGLVWYLTTLHSTADPKIKRLHCYDPSTDTDHTYDLPSSSQDYRLTDPAPMSDGSVLIYDLDNDVYRYSLNGSSIVEEPYPEAAVPSGPWWAGTTTDGSRGVLFDWESAWTWHEDCIVCDCDCGPWVGFIGIGPDCCA